MTFVEAVTW